MNYKNIAVFFLIILVLFGIGIRIFSLNKDFTGEETEFIKPAIAIKNTGYPIYYHSEQTPKEIFLSHPPMYIYLLAVLFKISISEISARILNISFSFLITILIFLFCKKIIGGEKSRVVGLISSAFFLINYYIFSSSVLIDIDVLSAFFVFGFVFFITYSYKNKKDYFLLLAGIFLFFGLANRYPIAIIVYFAIGVYYLLNEELRKQFKKYMFIGFFTFIIFTLIWGVYSILILPNGNFFSFISHNINFGAEQFYNLVIYLGSFTLNISQFIRLFSLPVVLLMIFSFMYFLKEKNVAIRINLIYVLSILVFFLIVPRPALGYPRYFMSMLPGVSILISLFIYKNVRNTQLNKEEIISILVISFLLSMSLLILFRPQLTVYASNGLIKATNLPDFIINLLTSFPLILTFLSKKEKRWDIFILMLIALALSYSLHFNYRLLTYDSHIKEVASYIKERTNESEIVIVPKAIGYYTGRRFYVNDNNKPELNFSYSYLKEYFKRSFENPKMDDQFFWPKGFYGGTSFYGINPSEIELEKASYVVLYHSVGDYTPEKKIGDFYIYKLNNR